MRSRALARLSPALARKCDEFGGVVVDGYLAGEKPLSRARAINGIDMDPVAQSNGRRAECALALWLGLDPLAVLDWGSKTDVGYDMVAGGLRIDVKSTGPNGRYLLWPVTKNDRLAEAAFDVLVLVRGAGLLWELVGWVDKADFLMGYRTFQGRPPLKDGTRYMEAHELRPMRSLLDMVMSHASL